MVVAQSPNQSPPSGPRTNGPPPAHSIRFELRGASSCSVMANVAGSIRPSRPAIASWNHRAPSGPGMIPVGKRCSVFRVGSGYSVMTPSGPMRPIWSAPDSVNHMAPSGPAVMPPGDAPDRGSARPARLLSVVGSG